MNRMELLGVVAELPKLRETAGGTACLEFYVNDTERQGETHVTQTFFVVLYGSRALIVAQKLVKGDEVWITGKYERRKVTTRGEGRIYEQLNVNYIRVIQPEVGA